MEIKTSAFLTDSLIFAATRGYLDDIKDEVTKNPNIISQTDSLGNTLIRIIPSQQNTDSLYL